MATGLLLVLLGIWGGLLPFVGPLFHFGIDEAGAWTMTSQRLFLHVLPGAAIFLGGLFVMRRRTIGLGGLLGLAGGGWFIIGTMVWGLIDTPVAGASLVGQNDLLDVTRTIAYNYGLGFVVTLFSAYALGKLAGSWWTRRRLGRRQEVATERVDTTRAA
jgi:hypothetical protein